MRVRPAIVCGFAIWAVTLVAAISAASIKSSNRPLFESIMPVVLSAVVVLAAMFYFRHRAGSVSEGVAAGMTWLAMSLALDGLMFSSGPMRMSLAAYMQDIGLTYLIIPVITAGITWSRTYRAAPSSTSSASTCSGPFRNVNVPLPGSVST